MSKQQRLELDATLRQGQFDLGADVPTLRAGFSELMAACRLQLRDRVGWGEVDVVFCLTRAAWPQLRPAEG